MASGRARIVQHPFAASMQGALLDSYDEEQHGNQLDLTLTVRSLEKTGSELFVREGTIYERIQGRYAPIRLHFSGVSDLKNQDFFTTLADIPPNDPARTLNDLLSWRQPERRDVFYLFVMQAPNVDNLRFFARHVSYERLSGETTPFDLERDWCPPPPMPERLIPQPRRLHQRFGGDPITLHIDGQAHHQRLFVGGLEIQGTERPQVDVVFNAGEAPSNWARDEQTDPEDRWDNKGEDSEGMSLEVMREEANWVIERLRQNQRVLVHCVAGLNRSPTICCATLILLEGLTAEEALARVREQHPWARPDSKHWLKLRWLAKVNTASRNSKQ